MMMVKEANGEQASTSMSGGETRVVMDWRNLNPNRQVLLKPKEKNSTSNLIQFQTTNVQSNPIALKSKFHSGRFNLAKVLCSYVDIMFEATP